MSEDVLSFKRNDPELRVLLGMELDWFPADRGFMERPWRPILLITLSGGFTSWERGDLISPPRTGRGGPEFCEEQYVAYFRTLRELALSGLVNIAAHPDIIKLFSIETFRNWLDRPAAST